jgi:predicted dehydrogenase
MMDRERPDFLDIVTRAETHLPLVQLSAQCRVAALCQKPMANTWAEALEIASVSRRAGIRLMMNENWRWQPWYRRMHDLLSEGRIGRVVFYRFHMRRRDGLGEAPYEGQSYMKDLPRLMILNVLVHFFDTARFLFGEMEEIYCMTQRINPAIAGEDLAVSIVRHQGGLCGVIDGHRFAESEQGGSAMCDCRIEGMNNVLALRGQDNLYLGSELVFDAAGIPGYKGDSCRAAQQHFVDCLWSGATFETDADEYLKSVACAEAAYRSAADNRPVRLSEFLQ